MFTWMCHDESQAVICFWSCTPRASSNWSHMVCEDSNNSVKVLGRVTWDRTRLYNTIGLLSNHPVVIYIVSIICPNISVGSPFVLTSGVSTGQPLPCPCTGSTTTSRWSAWNASGSGRMPCSGCVASRRICGRRRWSPKNARRRWGRSVDGEAMAVGCDWPWLEHVGTLFF